MNDTLLVQEGVSMHEGVLITGIANGQDSFSFSDNGQWILFEGTLDLGGGIDGAFLIEIQMFVLGDITCDGMISLLDVTPFVALLSSGKFLDKADINGDGVVDLLDIEPFVSLLLGE